jgi:hypothetical protein
MHAQAQVQVAKDPNLNNRLLKLKAVQPSVECTAMPCSYEPAAQSCQAVQPVCSLDGVHRHGGVSLHQCLQCRRGRTGIRLRPGLLA